MSNNKYGNKWDLEDGRTISLITPQRLKELDEGTVLYSIFGNKYVVGRDEIDTDTRGGLLAFGFLDAK